MVTLQERTDRYDIRLGDSLDAYGAWPSPTVIISDGAYGLHGFPTDPPNVAELPVWYEPHVRAWAEAATNKTVLWFWNSEIGWLAAHPVLERHGWRYVQCNVWNKGIGHVAGNVNTKTIRRFPVVTEVCVQYAREPEIGGKSMGRWLLDEWRRSGLPLRLANDACGVKNAATRKYFDQGEHWYLPPEMMSRLANYANQHGDPAGRPYFAEAETALARYKFRCPFGSTNVWSRKSLRDSERLLGPDGRAIHANQKPLDLMSMLIIATTDAEDVVWEPFGGVFSGSVAAVSLGRIAYGAEIDPLCYRYGAERLASIAPACVGAA